jgi:hypothetical protein
MEASLRNGRVCRGVDFVAAIMPEGIDSGKARKTMTASVFRKAECVIL